MINYKIGKNRSSKWVKEAENAKWIKKKLCNYKKKGQKYNMGKNQKRIKQKMGKKKAENI